MAPTAAFQRARTDEQRARRRAAILAEASNMLSEGTRIGDLSLNELARRVGLAKSNVLRYFESREAVLLELLDREHGAWLDAADAALVDVAPATATAHKPAAGVGLRTEVDADTRNTVELIAETLSRTVVERPVLSELVANAQLVLEQNVSAEVAAGYKRRAIAQAERLVGLIERHIGELSGPSRIALAGGVNVAIGGTWGQCRPSPGMVAAYERYPELAALRLDHGVALRELLATLLMGLLARPIRPPSSADDH